MSVRDEAIDKLGLSGDIERLEEPTIDAIERYHNVEYFTYFYDYASEFLGIILLYFPFFLF